MSMCIDKVSGYLEYLTDGLLKQKSPPKIPVVGEPPIMKDVINVKKANFVIQAHSGVGKTTFGLILYHKARLGELPGHDVIYIDMRGAAEAVRELGMFSEEKILRILFDHGSDEFKKVHEKIYATRELHLKCETFYKCLEKYYSDIDKRYSRKLIVVFDELDRVYQWDVVNKTLIDWFSKTRKFYDETFYVPLKLIILLPKVLKVKELSEALKHANEAAAVFTEFKELEISEEVLRGYIRNLGDRVNPVFKNILKYNGFNRLLKTLANIQSGRHIFPLLWKALSESVCKAVNNQVQDDVETFLKDIKELHDIDSNSLLDPLIIGIAEGMPFKTLYSRSRSAVIEMWEEGFNKLCVEGRGDVEGPRPLRIGYQNFICNLSSSTFIWMTLEKNISIETLRKIMFNILNVIGEPPSLINVVALVPKFSRGIGITNLRVGGEGERGRRGSSTRSITSEFKFKYRTLSAGELLSILSVAGLGGVDPMIADHIIKEIGQDIKSLIMRAG